MSGVNVTGGGLTFDASIDDSQFQKGIKKIENDIRSVGKTTHQELSQLENFSKKAATAVASFLSVQAATNFVQSMVQVRGEFQQLEVAYRTMLKSKSAADQLMAETVKLAAVTPFTLQDVASGSKQLLAYGFSAKSVTRNLEMLGNIASGVGAPLGDIVYLYGTLQTQGRAYQKDIMQFTGRGIPIIAELAKQFNVAESEVQKMVEAGKVGFPQVEKAFQNLTGAGGMFFNLMQEQSKTLTGQLSNLEDAWSRMLNGIGQQNEGVFATAIGTAISLVDNYQDVLDIIGLLIATYGAYRAALILQTVAQNLNTASVVTHGVVISRLPALEALHVTAITLKTRALSFLNSAQFAAMASTAAYTAAIVAVGAIIYSLSQVTDAATASQERLTNITDEAAKTVGKEQRGIIDLISVIKSHNSTIDQKDAAYKKLQETTNGTLSQYSLEEIAAGKAKGSIDQYISSIREATAARKAFSDFQDIADNMDELNKKGVESIGWSTQLGRILKNQFTPTSQGIGIKDWLKGWVGIGVSDRIVNQEKTSMQKQMDDLKKAYGNKWDEIISGVPNGDTPIKVSSIRSEAFIKKEIERLEGLKAPLDIHSKAYSEYTAKIKQLNDELSNSQGKLTTSQKDAVADRKRILKDITEAEEDAFAKDLTKDEEEIKRAKNKYKELRAEAKAAGLGSGVLLRVDKIEQKETGTITYNQDTKKLQNALEDQKKLYNQFEEYKKTLGIDKARERFAGEIDLNKTYLQILQIELDKLNDIDLNKLTGAQAERKEFLVKAVKEEADTQKRIRDQQFTDAIKASETFELKRVGIIDKYIKLEETLRSDTKTDNLQIRLDQLEEDKRVELKAIEDEAYQKTEIYRKLNEDIYFFSRERIKKEIKELKQLLKVDQTLSAAQKADIQSRIDQLEQLKDETNATAKGFTQISSDLSNISGIFSDLGSTIGSLNPGLADTLNTLGEIAQVGSDAAGSVAAFASGNIVGGIAKGVKAIAGVVNIFKKAKESAKEARAELEKWELDQFTAEFDVNEIFRERVRLQVKLNQTKITGLQKESELLHKQSVDVKNDYTRVLDELYKQSAIVGQKTEKYGGVFGLGRKTRVVDITEGLAGKSFNELEKLFLSGKLEGKARDLFETLRKIKEEGADIDQILEENKREAAELFTGTTAQSITDIIKQGFGEGLRTVQDFGAKTEDIIRGALLAALESKALEEPIKKLYDQFANDAQSGGGLDSTEIANFTDGINKTIKDAAAFADQLQKSTGINIGGGTSSSGVNSFKGSIRKELTEETGTVIAGQFNGLRLTAIEHLAIGRQSLSIITQSLSVQQKIEVNTRDTVSAIRTSLDFLKLQNETLRSIDTKVGGSLDFQLRAAGKYGY